MRWVGNQLLGWVGFDAWWLDADVGGRVVGAKFGIVKPKSQKREDAVRWYKR